MKTNSIKVYLILIVIAIWSNSAKSQVICRGHFNDDLYLFSNTSTNSNELVLSYFTEFGSKVIDEHTSVALAPWQLIAETLPGHLTLSNLTDLNSSLDYGKSFDITHFLPESPSGSYIVVSKLIGGTVPGEYYILGYDAAGYPYPNRGTLHRTVDDFQTIALINDSLPPVNYDIETGFVSGELYSIIAKNNNAFLTHSINYGVTFDTIPIQETILKPNSEIKHITLSRGSQAGELFLVTEKDNSATEFEYKIYHTVNFGNSWELKTTKVFYTTKYQQFTAGRGSCTFYMSNIIPTVGSHYYTLELYTSLDCGLTFIQHNYLLSPNVGTKDQIKDNPGLIISPNPATDNIDVALGSIIKQAYRIKITNVSGRICFSKLYGSAPTGNIQQISLTGIPNGVYVLSVYTDEIFVASKRFVVAK